LSLLAISQAQVVLPDAGPPKRLTINVSLDGIIIVLRNNKYTIFLDRNTAVFHF